MNGKLPHALFAAVLLFSAAAAPQEDSRALADYRAEITRIEAEQGPLASALSEPLLAAAALLSDEGRPREAVQFLRRALHVRRVNDGLHRLAHADIVEQIISMDHAIGDADALDRDYQFLYWLYRRNYGENDPRLVPVLERIARWRIHAWHLAGRGNDTLKHAMAADAVSDQALAIMEQHMDRMADLYVEALYRHAAINYLVARDAMDEFVSIHELRAAMLDHRRPMFDDEEDQVRLQLRNEAFFEGEIAVRKAREIAEARKDEDPVAYAEALAFEADYYYVFRRRFDAARRYRAAWEALAESGADEETFDRLFGRPRRLKPLLIPGEEDVPGGRRGWVEALVDVPASGWPENIKVTRYFPPDEPELAARGALGIAAVLFRPRLVQGEPVASSGVPVRYYLER
jgi:hypothetical protein